MRDQEIITYKNSEKQGAFSVDSDHFTSLHLLDTDWGWCQTWQLLSGTTLTLIDGVWGEWKRPKKCWATRAAGQSESTETLAEGCWGQWLVPFTLCWGDMIVWAQTVGTSAPKPVQRDLQVTRGTTGQQAVQGKETGARGRKQTWRETEWTNRKDALKKSS